MEKCYDIKVIGNFSVIEKDCCPNSHFKYITTTCSSEDSISSIGSESSSESFDDASSSSTCSSSESHLCRGISTPIQRGLSRYYQGKARTFTSLSDVKCIEDLAKKEIPFAKRGHRKLNRFPKSSISKKNARSSVNSLVSKRLDRP